MYNLTIAGFPKFMPSFLKFGLKQNEDENRLGVLYKSIICGFTFYTVKKETKCLYH